ncbi:MAG TPA: hypothetical protein VHJ18_07965, partial [Streptosporangiaceae bacterium]|nr:hypothetical protein [Streptosporangiaceae bacterium]
WTGTLSLNQPEALAQRTTGSAAPGLTSERSAREDVVVSHAMEDDELAEIEQRAALAFALAPTPWT